MAEIIIDASTVWDYFSSHEDELAYHMCQIASNREYGISVFITSDVGYPSIIVTADDTQVYEETMLDKTDCEETVRMVYDNYLTDSVVMILDELYGMGIEMTEIEVEDMIACREAELDNATVDFILAVLDDFDYSASEFDDICDDIKEHILEYMARKHHLPIRRPMYLEYDNGEEILEEFPYENMEFDDEDNPIYKS